MSTKELSVDSVNVRIDENWTNQLEHLLEKWRNQALANSDAHAKAAAINKKKHVLFGLPAVLITGVMAPVSAINQNLDGNLKYLETMMFAVSAALTGFTSFFKFSMKQAKHEDFSAQYAALVSDIDFELSRQQQFRSPADVTMTRYNMRKDSIDRAAPSL